MSAAARASANARSSAARSSSWIVSAPDSMYVRYTGSRAISCTMPSVSCARESVGGAGIAARDRREQSREALHVRCEQRAEDERLAAHRDLVEAELGAADAQEGAVGALDLVAPGGIDEERVELRQEFVARGAGDRPVGAQPLASGENLLDEDRELGARAHLADGGIEALEVVARIAQPIDVINAEPVELAVLHPLDDAACVAPKTAGSSMRSATSSLMSKKRR